MNKLVGTNRIYGLYRDFSSPLLLLNFLIVQDFYVFWSVNLGGEGSKTNFKDNFRKNMKSQRRFY